MLVRALYTLQSKPAVNMRPEPETTTENTLLSTEMSWNAFLTSETSLHSKWHESEISFPPLNGHIVLTDH